MTTVADIPLHARVALSHAGIQHFANAAGIPVLHIKGPALHTSLLQTDPSGSPVARRSTDVDLLCRPKDVPQIDRFLKANGWQKMTSFSSGSIFTHAATYWHDWFGYLDLHREFPGIGVSAADAFEVLWADSFDQDIAHFPCRVPSVCAQRLIMILHAGRNAAAQSPDARVAWHEASAEARSEVTTLVERLQAQVGFAAGIGELDSWQNAAEYELWASATSLSGSWLRSLRGRWRVASWWERPRLLLRVFFVNRDALALRLGHRPSFREVAREQLRRIGRLAGELKRLVRREI